MFAYESMGSVKALEGMNLVRSDMSSGKGPLVSKVFFVGLALLLPRLPVLADTWSIGTGGLFSSGTTTNVGIGTTTTSARLDVNGNFNVSNRTVITGNTSGQEASMVNQQQDSGAVANFRRANHPKTIIDNRGYIGIGFSAPSAALHGKGGIRLTDGASGMLEYIGVLNGAMIPEGRFSAGGNRDLRFINRDPSGVESEQARLNYAGNQGVGNNNPIGRLDLLTGNTRIILAQGGTGLGDGLMKIQNQSGRVLDFRSTFHGFAVETGTNPARSSSNGKDEYTLNGSKIRIRVGIFG